MPSELRAELRDARQQGAVVGLVPTMGYLHEGHASLMRRASGECDLVVVSIFVNPLQFGADEDYDLYPRDLERDLEMAGSAGAHLVFAPTVDDIYPSRILTTVHVSEVSEGLCGSMRPGHFDGVATVVAKLFNICEPNRAYFGKKDAQQLVVIRQMTADLNFPVEIVACPTVREPDGLAMSSRNAYLSPSERIQALGLIESLRKAGELLYSGERSVDVIEGTTRSILDEHALECEYAELREASSMRPVGRFLADGEYILAVAARVSGSPAATRLIDNILFTISGEGVLVDEGILTSVASVEATSGK